MKKGILTALVLTIVLLINAQTINSSKIYSSSILKTKSSDTTRTNDSVITYRSQINSKGIQPLRGYSNKYSHSYKDSSSDSKEEIIKQLTNSKQVKRSSTNKEDSLRLISESTDNLGFKHSKYQQYYKGIPVEGGTMIFHEKNGILKHVNGNYYRNLNIDTLPSYSFKKALKNAQSESNEQISISRRELVITPLNGNYELQDFRLCYKFSFTESTLYIDAHTGELANKISNSTRISTEGEASTLYNGLQTITTEFENGKYYLYDSVRNIYTYNGTNDSSWVNGDPFTVSSLFSDNDNDWGSLYYLDYFLLAQVNDNWYSFLVDETPDLYIKIYDVDFALVYTSEVQTNTNPPVLFPYINIPLSNPPYYVSILDYDNTTSDDLCGIVELTLQNGETIFNTDQNIGAYNISGGSHHIATDVHWGLEQTYDFYLNIFGRKSFDGNGDTISAWVNPNLFPKWNTNNAFASHRYIGDRVYDFMCYGLGDGCYMNPVISLDIVAHEFTHMVTNYSIQDYNNKWVGLKYQGESGAVNEGFSDIFATCVEFYTKGLEANWTIGEGVMGQTDYMRSLLKPDASVLNYNLYCNEKNIDVDSRQPTTYQGKYWKNTADVSENNDWGGVHQNNSIMNYWFYLLSVGGSGINDNNNSYDVQGIGIEKAAQIAYRNLTVYLTENSAYIDAYNGSLKAAEDLYGADSPEWWSVKNAWYAVGVINTNPNMYCDGQTKLTDVSGSITDGSGSDNYTSNSECEWLITPPGATSITIDFASFDTEIGYDSLVIYSSINANASAARLIWSGSTLPSSVTIDGGAALIKFYSDGSVEGNGWELTYSATTVPTCHGYTILTDTVGSFSDNSGDLQDYGNNQTCIWVIAPAGAETIELDITSLDTEQDYDGIIVFDGVPDLDNMTNLLGTYSGTVTGNVTAYSGEMWVLFSSDPFVTGDGFSATYHATATPFCEGVSVLTKDYGLIEDGSSTENYYHNSSCGWLIQPDDAISVTLQFIEFTLEEPEEDGRSYYDYVEIYDGIDETGPSLGKFGGSRIPFPITSSSGTMFVKFYSDLRSEHEGFKAVYYSQTATYCSPQSTYTNLQGEISDGSAEKLYGNNSDCKILIQPPLADSIILNISSFKTEENYDGLIIYDGVDTTAPQIAVLTGDTLPEPIVAESGSMLLWFVSDEAVRDSGWTAEYSTIQFSNIEEQTIDLKTGWNLISFYLTPLYPAIDSVFKNNLNEIEMIKNANWFYIPSQDKYLNSLAKIIDCSAYLIKCTNDFTLTMQGQTIDPDKLMAMQSLPGGWNYVACPYSVETDFSQVFNESNMIIIKNVDGFYEPGGGSLNSILKLQPGYGYFLKNK